MGITGRATPITVKYAAMITHCDECKTYFRVNIEQLRAANGQVKCGRCMHVFNALESLIEQHVDDGQEPVDLGIDSKLLQNNEQASVQKGPGKITEIFRLKNLKDPVDKLIRKLQETGFPNQTNSAASPSLDEQPDLLSESLGKLEQKELSIPEDSIYNKPDDNSSISTPLWMVISMFLLGFLFYQYFQFNVAEEKPSKQALCQLVDCPEDSTDTSSINLISRDIREHPQLSDVLLVNLTLVNSAAVEQAFPKLQIDLFDLSGRPVGSRRFIPSEYLDDSIVPMHMKPEQPVHIVLEIVGTSAMASSFEFTFL